VVWQQTIYQGTVDSSAVRAAERLVRAGGYLDIELLDHIIIGQNRFVSLKECGLGF
jgi:hypothetical protein